MIQQHSEAFDPMDKLLREALESDALPPSGMVDSIMESVDKSEKKARKDTPAKKAHKKWLVTAAACLVLVGAALPLALQSRGNETADHAVADGAMEEYTAGTDGGDDALVSSAAPNEQAQKQVDGTLHDQPYDPMDSALDHAAELLEQQGCTLEVLARTEDAVQVSIADAESHPSGNSDLVQNAMAASGFTREGDWYVLEQEDTTP